MYRARDRKLNRDVALKVLPESFASNAERLARFRREAQVLASLNHPHIAAIYAFEDSGSTHALVLELKWREDVVPRQTSLKVNWGKYCLPRRTPGSSPAPLRQPRS